MSFYRVNGQTRMPLGAHKEAVGLTVALGAEADEDDLDRVTVSLRRDLLQLDVDDVSRPRVEAPEGARALDAAALGSLLVTLTTTAGALTALVGAIRGWVGDRPDRTVTLEIGGDRLAVSGVSSAEQERLIRIWIDRHADA